LLKKVHKAKDRYDLNGSRVVSLDLVLRWAFVSLRRGADFIELIDICDLNDSTLFKEPTRHALEHGRAFLRRVGRLAARALRLIFLISYADFGHLAFFLRGGVLPPPLPCSELITGGSRIRPYRSDALFLTFLGDCRERGDGEVAPRVVTPR